MSQPRLGNQGDGPLPPLQVPRHRNWRPYVELLAIAIGTAVAIVGGVLLRAALSN